MSLYRHRPWWISSVPAMHPLANHLPLELPSRPQPRALPDDNASVRTIRALEEQLRAHVAVKGIEQ